MEGGAVTDGYAASVITQKLDNGFDDDGMGGDRLGRRFGAQEIGFDKDGLTRSEGRIPCPCLYEDFFDLFLDIG